MRRSIVVIVAVVVMLAMAGVPAAADQHIPPYGHMLILGLELDEEFEPVGYRKCVDLANNQALPLHAQHEHMHFGRAGEALFSAGHVVIPTSPFSDIDNCAHLAELFGPPSR